MISLISMIFNLLYLAIMVEVVLSWVNPKSSNQYINLLHKVTSPLLEPGRKLQYKYFNKTMIDFSPIIAIFILFIVKNIVFNIMQILGVY